MKRSSKKKGKKYNIEIKMSVQGIGSSFTVLFWARPAIRDAKVDLFEEKNPESI